MSKKKKENKKLKNAVNCILQRWQGDGPSKREFIAALNEGLIATNIFAGATWKAEKKKAESEEK